MEKKNDYSLILNILYVIIHICLICFLVGYIIPTADKCRIFNEGLGPLKGSLLTAYEATMNLCFIAYLVFSIIFFIKNKRYLRSIIWPVTLITFCILAVFKFGGIIAIVAGLVLSPIILIMFIVLLVLGIIFDVKQFGKNKTKDA